MKRTKKATMFPPNANSRMNLLINIVAQKQDLKIENILIWLFINIIIKLISIDIILRQTLLITNA